MLKSQIVNLFLNKGLITIFDLTRLVFRLVRMIVIFILYVNSPQTTMILKNKYNKFPILLKLGLGYISYINLEEAIHTMNGGILKVERR